MSAAATYAEALYEAARERDELERTLEDLQGFQQSVEENEELRLFYYSDRIAINQKRRAIDGLA
ncbi:MAG: F0F1 ATP synthase subunit delta, partial [Rubrobacter sp.]|nr:F0F1 ATP synthase subunit delta [Rubrobacter sp.]